MRLLTIFLGLILSFSVATLCLAESGSADSASGELIEKCKYPARLTIPNGRKSTESEMIAAQKKMKAFLAEGDQYIECLQNLEEKWGKEKSDEDFKQHKAVIVIFHNKIVDDMNAVAELFNSAVRAFKGKN